MKRKTRNTCLLDVIKIQNKEIESLHGLIIKLRAHEEARDVAWAKHSDERIRECNIAIRSSYQGIKK